MTSAAFLYLDVDVRVLVHQLLGTQVRRAISADVTYNGLNGSKMDNVTRARQ